MTTTRFAPSPTGPLHLGHAYSAVLAHQAVQTRGGRFHLRIDDIDGSRSREAFVAAAIDDLAWLGLDWVEPLWRQSDHLADYGEALSQLIDRKLAYPCFCTRADIAASLTAPHGALGAIYPGTCRNLAAEAREQRCLESTHCWRIDMAAAVAVTGPLITRNNNEDIRLDPASHGDVVLARKDAPASYHMASTLDDAAMGVDLVVRGADLLPSTAVHMLLQRLLGLPTPEYHHHRLVCGSDGKRLAKRNAPASLSALRAAGVDGGELASMLRVHQMPAGYSLALA